MSSQGIGLIFMKTYYLSSRYLSPTNFPLYSKEDAKQAMLYSYKHRFSGFSAMLNSTQAKILASKNITSRL
jgi:hypothetical protein